MLQKVSIGILLLWCTVCSLLVEDSRALVSPSIKLHHQKIATRSLSPSFARHKPHSHEWSALPTTLKANTNLNDNDDEAPQVDDTVNVSKTRSTSGRAGGRKKTPQVKPETKKKQEPPFWLAAVPLLALAVFVKSMFGGSDNGDSFVYYQSSVYESRVYTGDGMVERARRESVQSNVPSLLDGKRLRDSASTRLLESPDEEFDKELDAIIRMEQSFLNDFFY